MGGWARGPGILAKGPMSGPGAGPMAKGPGLAGLSWRLYGCTDVRTDGQTD